MTCWSMTMSPQVGFFRVNLMWCQLEIYQFKNNINLQTTPTISFKYRQDFADFGIVAYQISIAHCLYVGTSICIVIIMRDDWLNIFVTVDVCCCWHCLYLQLQYLFWWLVLIDCYLWSCCCCCFEHQLCLHSYLVDFGEGQWWVAWMVWCLLFMMIVKCKGTYNGNVCMLKEQCLLCSVKCYTRYHYDKNWSIKKNYVQVNVFDLEHIDHAERNQGHPKDAWLSIFTKKLLPCIHSNEMQFGCINQKLLLSWP